MHQILGFAVAMAALKCIQKYMTVVLFILMYTTNV